MPRRSWGEVPRSGTRGSEKLIKRMVLKFFVAGVTFENVIIPCHVLLTLIVHGTRCGCRYKLFVSPWARSRWVTTAE
jgi:hypothetical protein